MKSKRNDGQGMQDRKSGGWRDREEQEKREELWANKDGAGASPGDGREDQSA